ncbi:MAG: ComEC/Rec2 family competence protein [Holosporales bacterium]
MRLFLVLLFFLAALPVMAAPLRFNAEVLQVDLRKDGYRIILRAPAEVPFTDKIRLVVRAPADASLPRPFDRVEVLAQVSPPARASAPGAFDYRKYLAGQGITGLGFSLGQPVILPVEDVTLIQGVERWLFRLRLRLTRFFLEADNGGQRGALAAAFVTGQRGFLDDATNEAFRASGLYHYLSISGSHLTLVMGGTFVAVWIFFAASRLSLWLPGHRWAAGAAFVIGGLYVALSGFEIPAVRAFLMGSVLLLAVMLDRRVLSLWTLALAAIAILTVSPQAVDSPGFQLSFLAVTTLLLVIRALGRWAWLHQGKGWQRYVRVVVVGFLATTLAISISTAPLTAYYFQQVPLYSPVSNALAAPLSEVLVMPFLALASLTQWEVLAQPALWGLGWMLLAADSIASWPYASMHVRPFAGHWAAVLLGLLMVLWIVPRWWVRGVALTGIVLVCWQIALVPLPHLVIAEDGRSVGIVGRTTGTLTVLALEENRRRVEDWRKLYNLERADVRLARYRSAGAGCDGMACLVYVNIPDVGVYSVALVNAVAAMPSLCGKVDVILAPVPPTVGCGRLFTAGSGYFYRHGAMALRFSGVQRTIVPKSAAVEGWW